MTKEQIPTMSEEEMRERERAALKIATETGSLAEIFGDVLEMENNEPKTEADEATMEVFDVTPEDVKKGKTDGLLEKGKNLFRKISEVMDEGVDKAIERKADEAIERIEKTAKSLGLTKKDMEEAVEELKEDGKSLVKKFTGRIGGLKEKAKKFFGRGEKKEEKIESEGFEGKFDVNAESLPSDKHPGENQDAVFAMEKEGVFGVLDGMGGYKGGSLASQIAGGHAMKIARELGKLSPEDSLEKQQDAVKNTLIRANEEIKKRIDEIGDPELKKAGSTASIVKMFEDKEGNKKAIIGNVGDSRVYVQRADGKIEQAVSEDDLISTLLGEERAKELARADSLDDVRDTMSATPQLRETLLKIPQFVQLAPELFKKEISELSEKETRKVFGMIRRTVTKVLGTKRLEPTINTIDIKEGDRLIITSDGVHDNLTDNEIEKILNENKDSKSAGVSLTEQAQSRSRDKKHFRAKADDMSAVIVGVK